MLQLSVEQERWEIIYANIFAINSSLKSKMKSSSTILVEGLTASHMIKLVLENKQK